MASIGLCPYDQGMQNTTSLSSRSSLFGFGIFRGPRRVESKKPLAQPVPRAIGTRPRTRQKWQPMKAKARPRQET